MKNKIQAFFSGWFRKDSNGTKSNRRYKEKNDPPVDLTINGIHTQIPVDAIIKIDCNMARWELNINELIEIMDTQKIVKPKYSFYPLIKKYLKWE